MTVMAECEREPKDKKIKKGEGTNNMVNSNNTGQGGNLVSALIEHNKILDAKLERCEEREVEQKAKYDELQNQVEEIKKRLLKVDEDFQELEVNTTSSENKNKTTEEIQRLIVTYERLKSDEKEFKQTCHEELERLQLLSDQAEVTEASQGDVDAQLDRAKSRVESGRAELATLSRKVATLKRQIEQIPNRTELREYRLRFAELYNQVSATHRQTKQFFSLYNSLEDTKRYLEKELSLLNSIVDSYQQCGKSASGREEFLRQLSTLSDGIKETCSKVDKRFHAEKIIVERLQQELQRLVEQKVAYEKCLQHLDAECKTNDQLISACKKMESTKK